MTKYEIMACDDEHVINTAKLKFEAVQTGRFMFGRRFLSPSFKPPRTMIYSCRKEPSVMLLLNTIFNGPVMETEVGHVAIFPFTVFTTQEDMRNNTGGYPVLAFQQQQMKQIISSMYPNFKDSYEWPQYLRHVMCKTSPYDESTLSTVAGVLMVKSDKNRFILLPAQWLDVMKTFFQNQHLSTILPNMDKSEWEMVEAQINVKTRKRVRDKWCITFGKRCSDDVLLWINTWHTFLTGFVPHKPTHMLSSLHLQYVM